MLGILVGRGFLPGMETAISDLKGRIGKLPRMVSNNKSNDLRPSNRSEPDPKLDFYKKLSSKKDEAKKKKWQPKKKAERPKKERPPITVKATQDIPPESKEREGIETQKRGPKPWISETQYTVQIASLKEKIKAEKLIKHLTDRGYPAYYYEVEVNGKSYYRIRCGRFENRKEAENYAISLERDQGIEGFVSKLD